MHYVFQVFMMGCTGYAFYSKSLPLAGLGIAATLASLNWDSVHDFIVSIKDGSLRVNKKGVQVAVKRHVTADELLASPRVPRELKKSVYDAVVTAEIPDRADAPKALPGIISADEAVKRVAELPDIIQFSKGKKVAFLPSEPEAYALKGAQNLSYQIQVAESMETHLATYDFIYVDAKTGEVIHRENY